MLIGILTASIPTRSSSSVSHPFVAAPGGLPSLYLRKEFMTPVTFFDGGGDVSVSIDASTNSAYANRFLDQYTTPFPVDFEFHVGPVDYVNGSDPNNIYLAARYSTTVANGSFTVSYTYSSVPEPSTWAMMLTGFGLVAGAAFARRRAASAA